MTAVDFGIVEQAMRDITDSIPGPQEGESIFEFRARIDDSLVRIVTALGERKTQFEKLIKESSDDNLSPTDQFYNAARRRFITDEFEEE